MAKTQNIEKNGNAAVKALAKWQLQDAKAKFSEVIRRVATAPQAITVNGKMSAIVISAEDYQKFFQPKPNLVELLENSPLKHVELDLRRNKSAKRRKVKL